LDFPPNVYALFLPRVRLTLKNPKHIMSLQQGKTVDERFFFKGNLGSPQ
jgi:hypothetical protein